ncbi:MAG: DNA polymerase III subunit chi [Proteobacteria bacterium]|nr:DNA polymerase III subunit chi [Pseudomonadota bacterium]
MTAIAFYHLEASTLETVLAKLLEKALAGGLRVVVKAGSEERVAALDTALWTYEQGSFLAHGSAQDGNGLDQPVWLTHGDDNPNSATVLFLTDGSQSAEITGYDRCLELFDGRDVAALEKARSHWQAYKDGGHELTYWRQGARGGWQQQDP